MDLSALALHDLNLLVSLHALLRARHVSRAATQLGVSQPAMSRVRRGEIRRAVSRVRRGALRRATSRLGRDRRRGPVPASLPPGSR